MHYMAGAWAHRMSVLEKEAAFVFNEDGKVNPLFRNDYAEDLKERYRHAVEQFRYWEAYGA